MVVSKFPVIILLDVTLAINDYYEFYYDCLSASQSYRPRDSAGPITVSVPGRDLDLAFGGNPFIILSRNSANVADSFCDRFILFSQLIVRSSLSDLVKIYNMIATSILDKTD